MCTARSDGPSELTVTVSMINSASRKVWHTPVRLYGLSLHLSTLAVTSSAPCPSLPSPTMPSTFSAAMGRLAFAPNLSFLPRQSLLQRYQHRTVPETRQVFSPPNANSCKLDRSRDGALNRNLTHTGSTRQFVEPDRRNGRNWKLVPRL